MKRPLVSLCVVNFYSFPEILFALECLHRVCLHLGTDCEIILLTHGVKRATKRSLASILYPQVREFVIGRNLGFAGAANLLLSLAKGRYVFIMNADVLIDWQSLANVLRILESVPEAGLVSPLLYNLKGEVLPENARRLPSLPFVILNYFFRSSPWRGVRKEYLPGTVYLKVTPGEVQPVPVLAGACIGASRDVWMRIGGIPVRRLFMYEDVEVCKRAIDNGYTNLLVGTAKAVHVKSTTLRKIPYTTSWYLVTGITQIVPHLMPINAMLPLIIGTTLNRYLTRFNRSDGGIQVRVIGLEEWSVPSFLVSQLGSYGDDVVLALAHDIRGVKLIWFPLLDKVLVG